MTIDVYSAAGTKKETLSLPEGVFNAPINETLMRQALMLQQSNRRSSIAHAKNRGEVAGSTRKLYSQKHTGRARRGSVRSPLLRGGGKAFGPRSDQNYVKEMPKAMRRAALLSCLSFKAKQGALVGLESYADTIKTKEMAVLLKKLPVELGRKILFVLPETNKPLALSARNIPGVKTLLAAYLNPEDLLTAKNVIFLSGAVEKVEELWGKGKAVRGTKSAAATSETSEIPKKQKSPRTPKKTKTIQKAQKNVAKKTAAKTSKNAKDSSESSGSSDSSES